MSFQNDPKFHIQKPNRGQKPVVSILDETAGYKPVPKRKKDKRRNTPEFNKKWKQRRAKAKHDAKARKRNQK